MNYKELTTPNINDVKKLAETSYHSKIRSRQDGRIIQTGLTKKEFVQHCFLIYETELKAKLEKINFKHAFLYKAFQNQFEKYADKHWYKNFGRETELDANPATLENEVLRAWEETEEMNNENREDKERIAISKIELIRNNIDRIIDEYSSHQVKDHVREMRKRILKEIIKNGELDYLDLEKKLKVRSVTLIDHLKKIRPILVKFIAKEWKDD